MDVNDIVSLASQLRPEDFEFTVEVCGHRFDVYSFVHKGKVGTIALAIIDGKAVVPVVRVGLMTEAEMTKEIEKAIALAIIDGKAVVPRRRLQ